MPDIVVIHIFPDEVTPGNDFTNALNGLVIRAFDVSFDNPEGTFVGEARFLPDNPSESRIAQHYIDIVPDTPPIDPDIDFPLFFSAATAVIEIAENEPLLPEYGIEAPEGNVVYSVDLLLEIERNDREILSQQIYYNCPVITVNSVPEPFVPESNAISTFPSNPYATLTPVAIYLKLPGAGRELDPDVAFIDLSLEGPPPFSKLLDAVTRVLEQDPGGNIDPDLLANLTSQQCLHIANEIVHNPIVNPPPEATIDTIAGLYTGENTNEDEAAEIEGRRLRFEGELEAYEAESKAKASRLANFIFALSSAINSELLSRNSNRVGFSFPVHSELPNTPGKLKGAEVLLTGSGSGLLPSFVIPAVFFYVLGANIPLQVTKEQRHKIAILEPEEQTLNQLKHAIEAGVIAEISTAQSGPETANVFKAVRLLTVHGRGIGTGTECILTDGSPEQDLVEAWLNFLEEDITEFWFNAFQTHAQGHLNLVLCALTQNHEPLSNAIRNNLGITNVDELASLLTRDWQAFFAFQGVPPATDILPFFTQGTPEERIQDFIARVRAFFNVPIEVESPDPPTINAPPSLPKPLAQVGNVRFEPFQQFIAVYNAFPVASFAFGGVLSDFHIREAAEDVFPDDSDAQAWLEQAIRTINDLFVVTNIGVSDALHFSLMEALYAKGFTSIESIQEYDSVSFQNALTGTVAWQHAAAIAALAQLNLPSPLDEETEFQPINSDCCLVNCIPPPHLSPLGPIAYLSELIRLSEISTCEDPLPRPGNTSEEEDLVSAHLDDRCHDLTNLLVTQSNLEVPIPLIDMVNECLEAIASTAPNPIPEHTPNTNSTELAGHTLCPLGPHTEDGEPSDEFCHTPSTLFCVVPEHSSPATPVDFQDAYTNLAGDFSHCLLPYSQPLDINRTYLSRFFGTTRYQSMRTFWVETSEFPIDPLNPSADFESFRWREPVAEAIAAEYLGISPEVLETLFHQDVPLTDLPTHYGFISNTIDGEIWLDIVVQLKEFLKRTCLSYCQFLELWRSEFVVFHRAQSEDNRDESFPNCEPCNLDDYSIVFDNPADPEDALRRLNGFIRLWRILQAVPSARYSFEVLRDICNELLLFNTDGTINPNFIRELYALQRLRDLLGLPLQDPENPPSSSPTDANRTQLLQLTNPGASRFRDMLDELLDRLQPYAQATYHCPPQPPHYLRLLEQNLTGISRITGFDPDTPGNEWFAHWPNILRFVEVLGKIYASRFTVGQLLFLFTVNPQLTGVAPLPAQTNQEAEERPFDFVNDDPTNSLFALRENLLSVTVKENQLETYTWSQIELILREELGYVVQPGDVDFLSVFGNTFVPSLKEAAGITVPEGDRRFRTSLSLTDTNAPMWNTPIPGVGASPFFFDLSAGNPANPGELWAVIPLVDADVNWKLGRVRSLNPNERQAVKTLYAAPREVICALGFLFPNKVEADEHLIQEPDEAQRVAYFLRSFALFYARYSVIAEHFADHMTAVTGASNHEGVDLAKTLLTHLRADDNFISFWDTINSGIPDASWSPSPLGSALHALLGLVGTGLQRKYRRENGIVAWQDTTGNLNLQMPARNAVNAPIPTVIPSLALGASNLTPFQNQILGIRNGYGLNPETGEMLGGLETYTLELSGFLLVDDSGNYEFQLHIDPAAERYLTWFVRFSHGHYVNNVLVKDWPDEEGPEHHSGPVRLQRGVHKLQIFIKRKALEPDGSEDRCPQTFSWRLTYSGPDTHGEQIDVPHERLYLDRRDAFIINTSDVDNVLVGSQVAVVNCYEPPIWVIRRTCIRLFKALLIAWNHRFSPTPITDSSHSEIGFFLENLDLFPGVSYFHNNLGGLETYRVSFVPDALPVSDNHTLELPNPSLDQRAEPSLRHIQALFDIFFEALFDYTQVREETSSALEAPTIQAFNEWLEAHVDAIAHGLRHLGIHLFHETLVLNYFPNTQLTDTDLVNFHWLYRVWQAEKWIRAAKSHFYFKNDDVRDLQPHLITALPDQLPNVGNANLTQACRDGCFENGEPYRYQLVEDVNNLLRLRARQHLIAYLTRMERVALPWGGFAETAKDLSELLLMDVEAGVCQKASRVEAAISAVHLFIQRAWFGLEPDFEVTPEFKQLWDSRFATFYIWQACKRQALYPENYIHITEQKKALRSEAFQFLVSQLRETTLTVPVPGSLAYWLPNQKPPVHPSLTLLQSSEPVSTQLLPPSPPTPEGFHLRGIPDRNAQPSWLAPLRLPPVSNDGIFVNIPSADTAQKSLPFWIQAAIRPGENFIHVDAAGISAASAGFVPRRDPELDQGCCIECGKPHLPTMDYYYFWLLPSRYFDDDDIEQNADWGVREGNPVSDWHRSDMLPGLLHWESSAMVHLVWCRFHNGEIAGAWRSDDGVRIIPGQVAQLEYLGREDDSLYFSVINGQEPLGFNEPRSPGFVVHLAAQTAEVLPRVVEPEPHSFVLDGLQSYPYFAYFASGAPLVPPTLFSPVLAIADQLRTHCQFEAALKWYECYYEPLQDDLSELWCHSEDSEIPVPDPEPNPEPDPQPDPDPIPVPVPLLLGQTELTDDIKRKRSLVLHYLTTLLQWGDAVMRQHSPEASQKAKVILDAASRILGDTPKTIQGIDTTDPPIPLSEFEEHVHEAPLNPSLLCLYDKVEDRLTLIRNCINAWRLRNSQPNKHMPYWGNSPLRDCGQTTVDPCLDMDDWCYPHSCYRFEYLIQKALELANEVSRFEAALLAAFEKGDAEYLATLRVTHERQIFNLTLEIRQLEYRVADWEVQALEKAFDLTRTRRNYYANLIERGLISGEITYQTLTGTSTASRAAANILEAVAAILRIIPNLETGNVGPLPSTNNVTPIGDKISQASSIGGTIANTVADISSTTASLRLTEAGWFRRGNEEWPHSVETLGIELEQIVRQIHAAEQRRNIADRELNHHQRQMEQAAEIQAVMHEKFTNHSLYLWMQGELAALHYQLYECAFHTARQAERAFNYERGHTTRKFITGELWDNLHEGLLAGDRLVVALRQMEKAYRDEHCREYELTEHFSLRRYFPWAFLQLKLKGYCEFTIPEWMYDHFYPGHYMRRIKNVSLTIPCVVGPYVSIHCRLTLLKSTTRIAPYLIDPPSACCNGKQPKNGYVTKPDAPVLKSTYAAKEAIATSSGQNDAGLFELNFRDERYLPFEYAGAVSCWRLEMPQVNNQFDFDTISDVILHMNYMAREGGSVLQQAASQVAQCNLLDQGIRFFDVRIDFLDLWHRFQVSPQYQIKPQAHEHYTSHSSHPAVDSRELELRLGAHHFPYLSGSPELTIQKIHILFEAPGADPSAYRIVEFLANYGEPMSKHRWKCDSISIYCVANVEWPGLFHGVLLLEPPLGPLHKSEELLGTFRFSTGIGEISNIFLFCDYSVSTSEDRPKELSDYYHP